MFDGQRLRKFPEVVGGYGSYLARLASREPLAKNTLGVDCKSGGNLEFDFARGRTAGHTKQGRKAS